MLIYSIVLLVCIFIILVILSTYAISTVVGIIRARGVPFVPLSRGKVAFLNETIKLNMDDRVVDLGCGEGRVLRSFEKQGVKVLHGYEVNFWAVLLGRIQNLFLRSKVKIYFKNFNKVNLAEYNVVFCYLLEGSLRRLRSKFDRELRPGAKIISCDFEIKDWHRPSQVYSRKVHGRERVIYVYQKGSERLALNRNEETGLGLEVRSEKPARHAFGRAVADG